MGKIFGNIGNMFKNKCDTFSTLKAFMYALIPFGPLAARIFDMDGSLDKKWLLLPPFMIFPFSIIHVLAMKFCYIKKGKGGKPYDWGMLIPVMLKLFTGFIVNMFDFPVSMIVDLLINLIPIFGTFIVRSYKLCKKTDLSRIANATLQSFFSQGLGNLLVFGIGYVPFVGAIVSVLQSLPLIGGFIDTVIWGVGYLGSYMVFNMLNADNKNKFCDKKPGKINSLLGLVGIIITIFMKISGGVQDMLPF